MKFRYYFLAAILVSLFGCSKLKSVANRPMIPRINKTCIEDSLYYIVGSVGHGQTLTPILDTNGKPAECTGKFIVIKIEE